MMVGSRDYRSRNCEVDGAWCVCGHYDDPGLSVDIRSFYQGLLGIHILYSVQQSSNNLNLINSSICLDEPERTWSL